MGHQFATDTAAYKLMVNSIRCNPKDPISGRMMEVSDGCHPVCDYFMDLKTLVEGDTDKTVSGGILNILHKCAHTHTHTAHTHTAHTHTPTPTHTHTRTLEQLSERG